MAYKKTERTEALFQELRDNVDKLQAEYKKNPSEDNLILMNDANDHLAIFVMTLGTLDEVKEGEKNV